MTNHPITPPPELVAQWRKLPEYTSQLQMRSTVTLTTEKLQDIATQAARWGADQELEACCKSICNSVTNFSADAHLKAQRKSDDYYTLRRPKSQSLKSQALAELEILKDFASGLGCDGSAIHLALEQLND